MRILVTGYGSIGRRHLANIRKLEPSASIAVLRRNRIDRTLPSGADHVYFSFDDAIAFGPHAAFLCGPAIDHASLGVALARAGAHLFVEKPLSDESAGAESLVTTCAQERRVLAVGYNLRFAPALQAMRAALEADFIGRPMSLRAEVGQHLADWRVGVDYRTSPSARAELGGGVALELSHEFDYIRWLCGEVLEVRAFMGRLGDLDIDVEDTIEAILLLENGILGSVHLDMVQRSPTRTCRIVGTAGTLLWDGIAGTLARFRPGDGWTMAYQDSIDRDATYYAEAASFLAATRGESEPVVSGIDGLRALEIALAVKRSSLEGRAVHLHEKMSIS
jgi:predicted dehydrogenase